MSLTFGYGPLSRRVPETVNYRLDGPQHRLLLHPFPRRIRAVVGEVTVLDTERGRLLHETGLLPVLYVPLDDIRDEVLTPSDHTTHCPFKGDARYWHLRVGDRTVDNAVWSYPEPNPESSWLRGLASMYWEAADGWLDEDEHVQGHLRDPYHRVDVRRSSRRVRVTLGDEVIAESDRPRLLSETGLPNRLYLPPEDVRRDLLQPSETTSVCPYKGNASYWSLRVGDRRLDDAAWSYPAPLAEALDVAGYLCFLHDDLTVTSMPG
ncbi:DUF427 domain-containing protein [Allonocardiopsis opalescens]|uniref:Uncharacterized protein (DUF427 family) n=1 Tax=Allonocardiopsis opalescens TaxID=1144618 RepID=A0A2T0Q0V6_9ACTN|nr:DUF427 domain-containing protein [Allonocardiopsis opalescens]PRX97421.1 uncharacterized protein (DUF427 family) [Allonocardiopsis opalescens]